MSVGVTPLSDSLEKFKRYCLTANSMRGKEGAGFSCKK
uniref:Uncharacterized protein n=1 Tax=Caudovirales sp. ct1Jx6 TaxID=2826765 RepID=A0A8S5ML47_9CAUD|nr:MAG TPA: hypothetical protein [Caudovirales sp. ct1Jx6]